nr:MAG TPA: hypothetical protein [Caudoviricetes sp.]
MYVKCMHIPRKLGVLYDLLLKHTRYPRPPCPPSPPPPPGHESLRYMDCSSKSPLFKN